MKESSKEEDLPHLQILMELKERSHSELFGATKRVSVANIMAEYKANAGELKSKKKKNNASTSISLHSLGNLPVAATNNTTSSKRRNSMLGAAQSSACLPIQGASSSKSRRASQPDLGTSLQGFLEEQVQQLQQEKEELNTRLNDSGNMSSELSGLVDAHASEMQKIIAVCKQQKEHIDSIEQHKKSLEQANTSLAKESTHRRASLQEQKNKLEKTKEEVSVLKRDRKSLRKQLKQTEELVSANKQRSSLKVVPPSLLSPNTKNLLDNFQDRDTDTTRLLQTMGEEVAKVEAMDAASIHHVVEAEKVHRMIITENSGIHQGMEANMSGEPLEDVCYRQKAQLIFLGLDKEMMEEALGNAKHENKKLQIQLEEFKKEANNANAACSLQQEQLDSVQLTYKSAESEIERLRQAAAQKVKTVHGDESTLEEILSKMKNVQENNELLVHVLKSKEEESAKMQDLRSSQLATIESLKDTIEYQTTDIENLQNDTSSLLKALSELERLKDTIELQATEIHSLEADKALLSKDTPSLETMKDTVEAQMGEIVSLQKENESLTKKLRATCKAKSLHEALKNQVESQRTEIKSLEQDKEKLQDKQAKVIEDVEELRTLVETQTRQVEKYEEALKQQETHIRSLQAAMDEAYVEREEQQKAEAGEVGFNVEEHITQLATLKETEIQTSAELSHLREALKAQVVELENYKARCDENEKQIRSLRRERDSLAQKQDYGEDASSEPSSDDIDNHYSLEAQSSLEPVDDTTSAGVVTKSVSLATGTLVFAESGASTSDEKDATTSEFPVSPQSQTDDKRAMQNIVDIFSLGRGVLHSFTVPKDDLDEVSLENKGTALANKTIDYSTPRLSNATRVVEGPPPLMPFPLEA